MSRYYDQPIQMLCDGDGAPVRFIWRERAYQVLAVLARWHLRDRWWVERPASAPRRSDTATDRFYWRLHCASPSTQMVFCIVYYDAAASTEEPGQWPWWLERVYD